MSMIEMTQWCNYMCAKWALAPEDVVIIFGLGESLFKMRRQRE